MSKPLAYTDEADDQSTGQPATSVTRFRWTLATAALLASAAAFVIAGAHGIQTVAPTQKTVTVTTTPMTPLWESAGYSVRDSDFLTELTRVGVTYDNTYNAISDAYVLCAARLRGVPDADNADTVAPLLLPITRAEMLKTVAVHQLSQFIEIAHTHYCPKVTP